MILIAANQDTVFARLAEAMGQAQLIENEHYAGHAERGRHQQELDQLISAWTSTQTAAELVEKMEQHGVPVGKIYRAPEMLEDPHFAAREAIIKLAHPEFGELAMQNVVPKLSLTPGTVRWPGPTLGQHNKEVLQGLLGLSEETLGAFREAGTI